MKQQQQNPSSSTTGSSSTGNQSSATNNNNNTKQELPATTKEGKSKTQENGRYRQGTAYRGKYFLCTTVFSAQKAIIHQVTTMLATSKNALFPGHSHQY